MFEEREIDWEREIIKKGRKREKNSEREREWEKDRDRHGMQYK